MPLIALLSLLVLAAALYLFVFLVWLFFAGVTAVLLSGANKIQRLTTSGLAALPFAGLAFLMAPVLIAWSMSRPDIPGSCHLPNGYELMIVGQNDPGWVYDAKNVSSARSINWKKESLAGVVVLQIHDQYILGGLTSRGINETTIYPVDSYFLLDSKSGETATWHSLRELRAAASERGISIDLKNFYDVYSRYGTTTTGRVSHIALLICLAVFGLLTFLWIIQFPARRTKLLSVKHSAI
jgi:hypothetical protein